MTASGKAFWPLDPRAEEIDIFDIARSLSYQCRFAGHLESFYSVAQHSVHVSQACEPANAAWGLLHDASEAYCQDIIRPVKRHLASYVEIEERIQKCIAERFNLCWPMPKDVKMADDKVLLAEIQDLRMPPPAGYSLLEQGDRASFIIKPWPFNCIEDFFTDHCEELGLI